jgi:hypothetical protein
MLYEVRQNRNNYVRKYISTEIHDNENEDVRVVSSYTRDRDGELLMNVEMITSRIKSATNLVGTSEKATQVSHRSHFFMNM